MKDDCSVDLVRPTTFHYNISAQLVSKLAPKSNMQKVCDWHHSDIEEGNEKDAAVVPDKVDRDVVYN